MGLSAAERQRNLRQKRLQNGLCMSCGLRPPIMGLTRCETCRTTHSKDSETRHTKRREAGLCYCGALAVNGFATCEKHKIAALERQEQITVVGLINELCKRCGKPSTKTHCHDCSKILSEHRKQHRRKLRDTVFAMYGGYVCSCCEITEPLFLTIDHINNDGAAHRRSMVGGRQATSERLYRWLRDNNFPLGFQVLCMNCNLGKQRNGGICPHHTKILLDDYVI